MRTAVKLGTMASTKAEARRNLKAAVARLGGNRKVGALCDVNEWAVKLWLKSGNLNKVQARNAERFAKAAGEPLQNFLVEEG
jgi:hypothetical protein